MTIRPSGLIVPRQRPKFACQYVLDDRLDKPLVDLNQRIYRSLQSFLDGKVNIRLAPGVFLGKQLLPDAVQVWVAYLASLIYGAADSALTLSLHNLGREARILERQIYEYVMKAWYFQRHPRVARKELEVMPFRDLSFITQAGVDRRKKRYREAKAICDKLRVTRPALAAYAKSTETKDVPSVKQSMPGRMKSRKKDRTYTRAYRWPSQTVHATVLGMESVFKDNGLKFDSRLDDPNITVLMVSRSLVTFMTVVENVFALNKGAEITAMHNDLAAIEARLLGS